MTTRLLRAPYSCRAQQSRPAPRRAYRSNRAAGGLFDAIVLCGAARTGRAGTWAAIVTSGGHGNRKGITMSEAMNRRGFLKQSLRVSAGGALVTGSLVQVFGGHRYASSLMACIWIVGLVLVWFTPETRGSDLPE